MLKIRQDQLDMLGALVEKKFKRQMCAQLRADYPLKSANLTEQQLSDFVDRGVEKSKSYMIDIKSDVADFLVILLHHGLDFEMHPDNDWAHEILTDPDLQGGTKILQLQTQFDEQEIHRG